MMNTDWNKYMTRQKMILTAGPSITQKEIDYVTDAVTNCYDEHWADYIKRFEKAFAEYLEVKHAMTTSSCTGALHLALVALGIGKGDEVIVPDMSWIATASAVCYTGAKPVFADVLPYTWCIDQQSIREKITSRTKAIIPVHLYGHPADMGDIEDIADEHNLWIVEDAAPALGAKYQGVKVGSWGTFGCFSFQGAKMVSTGEGGMLVTSNTELYEKAKHYAEHGRISSGFEIGDIGFKYKMSNLQAALGLAQLERIDELIAKKKQIFNWYYEELKGIDYIFLNDKPHHTLYADPIYWMTSMVLHREVKMSRVELIHELKNRNVDTGPFFPPISSFRMFKNANNSTARFLGERGLNLPSGHRLEYEDVKYVCDCIKDILKNE